MKHTADGRFRVNVGVVHPTPVTPLYRVRVRGTRGQRPGDSSNWVAEVLLAPYSMKQFGGPGAEVSGGEWSTREIVLLCPTEGAGGFMDASVVDNATNHAYFVRGIKLLTPGGQ